jgi:nicotinate (nicotinamide) nucleotide adenylyltransferase
MSERKIAVFGGSFNPPGIHHRLIAKKLVKMIDEVVILPCGTRPDKSITNDIEPSHRAAMVSMNFRDIPGVTIDLSDLEKEGDFTTNYDLQQRYISKGKVWHVVGADLIQGGASGRSPIQMEWFRGNEIWDRFNFIVAMRSGIPLEAEDLPPSRIVLEPEISGASSEIRERIFRHRNIHGLVTSEVEDYIRRYNLYRGTAPSKSSFLHLETPKLLVISDKGSKQAQGVSQTLQFLSNKRRPNMIAVVGGDGTMLGAIKKHWSSYLPFFGINTGHLGFLLNDIQIDGQNSLPDTFTVHNLPMLYFEATLIDGGVTCGYAFNDVWLERQGPQTGWCEVSVDGTRRIDKLVGDGVLVSTPQGSTAYARALGAAPIPLDTSSLILVGSNIVEPIGWKYANLSLRSEIELKVLERKKRPVVGYYDGEKIGKVDSIKIRVSRAARVELAFTPGRDLAEKISSVQFKNHF